MALISALSGLARSVAARRARRLQPSHALIRAAFAVTAGAVPWYFAGARSAAIIGGCLLCAGRLLLWVGEPARAATRWRAGSVAVEAAVYAAMAAGASGPGQEDAWALATAALALLAVRGDAAGDAVERVLLIAVVTPAIGVCEALVALLCWGTLALAADVMLAARRAAAGDATGGLDPAGARRRLMASRGDGALAGSAGRLLRGQAPPLAPALVGLAATAVLVLAGGPPRSGPAALAPVAVLLLAAPGAGHPHDRRWDWLAPPALRAGESLCLAGLGFAAKVPAPLTFALVALVAIARLGTTQALAEDSGQAGADRDAARRRPDDSLAAEGPRAVPRPMGAGPPAVVGAGQRLGWEGRLLLAGLSAALGVPVFAYLTLSAYLGLALAWQGLSRTMPVRRFFWLAVREGEGK